MKPICLVSLFVCIFFSCKKDKPAPNYSFPITLKLVGITKNSDVQVYTKDGQITDNNIIQKFAITRFVGNPTNYSVFNISLDIDNYKVAYYDTISFISKDTLLVGHNQAIGNGFVWGNEKYAVTQNGEQFLFYSKDSYELDRTDSLFKYLYPKLDLTWQQGVGGAQQVYTRKATLVANGNVNELSMSCTCFKLKEDHGGVFYLAEQCPVFNEFNPNFVKTLLPGDTVAVQSYSFTYKKVN